MREWGLLQLEGLQIGETVSFQNISIDVPSIAARDWHLATH